VLEGVTKPLIMWNN